jgi:hypothetical protein
MPWIPVPKIGGSQWWFVMVAGAISGAYVGSMMIGRVLGSYEPLALIFAFVAFLFVNIGAVALFTRWLRRKPPGERQQP